VKLSLCSCTNPIYLRSVHTIIFLNLMNLAKNIYTACSRREAVLRYVVGWLVSCVGRQAGLRYGDVSKPIADSSEVRRLCPDNQSTRYNQLIHVFFSLFRKMHDYYGASITSQLFPSKFYTFRKIVLPLCTMPRYTVLVQEQRESCAYSYPRQWVEVSDQLQAPAALYLGRNCGTRSTGG
jgi:hypothetical protein